MPITKALTPPVAIKKQTGASSVSTKVAEFQEFDRGLLLRENLDYDAWVAIGKRQATEAGASTWRLGDWLAYGHANYEKSKWGNSNPDELYVRLAEQIGISYGTLRNAKWVCSALPLSRRRDKLTFGHAQEIVGRIADAKEYDQWIARVVDEGLSIKKLREEIRKAKAVYKPEHADTGDSSILETARQFGRDYLAVVEDLTPSLRIELRKILDPVLRDLASG